MKEISQIRSLSLWIFLIPFFAVNTCLLISVNYILFDDTFFSVDQIGRSEFTIPYLDGSLSISRASRTFPQFLIFKPSMIITAILLCFYWHKTNLLINFLRNVEHKVNIFMIFGILSAIFLIIHSLFLGVETDIKIVKFLRRVILLGFIIFEIVAQSTLLVSLYKIKNQKNNFFNLGVLKIKIILVSILVFIALVSIPLLIKTGNVHFKHGLEWNYFIGIILFYLLTSFLWKKII
jgi:hypothetical protein